MTSFTQWLIQRRIYCFTNSFTVILKTHKCLSGNIHKLRTPIMQNKQKQNSFSRMKILYQIFSGYLNKMAETFHPMQKFLTLKKVSFPEDGK